MNHDQPKEMKKRIIGLVEINLEGESLVRLYLHLFGKDDELYRDYKASQETD